MGDFLELLGQIYGEYIPESNVDPDPPEDGPPEAAQDVTTVAPGAMTEQANNPSTTSQIIQRVLNPPDMLSEQDQAEQERVESGQHAIEATSPLSHALRRLANSRLGRLAGNIGEIAGVNEPYVGPLAAFAGEVPMARGASVVDDAARWLREARKTPLNRIRTRPSVATEVDPGDIRAWSKANDDPTSFIPEGAAREPMSFEAFEAGNGHRVAYWDEQGELGGYIDLMETEQPHLRDWDLNINVRPDLRRRGIGSALLEQAEREIGGVTRGFDTQLTVSEMGEGFLEGFRPMTPGVGAPGRLPAVARDPLGVPAFVRRMGRNTPAELRPLRPDLTPAVYVEGKVYRGANHGDALNNAAEATGKSVDEIVDESWGTDYIDLFEDAEGNLLNRFSADEKYGVTSAEDLDAMRPRNQSSRTAVDPNADLSTPAYTRRGADRSAEMEAVRRQGLLGGMLGPDYIPPSQRRLPPAGGLFNPRR